VTGQGRLTNNTTLRVERQNIFGTDVDGNGTIQVLRSRDEPTVAEFKGAVSYGQDVRLGGDTAESATVTVDHPETFKASLGIYTITPLTSSFEFGLIDLQGLHATSYDVKQNALELFKGNRVVDIVRLDANTQVSNVWQGETGIRINIGISDIGASTGTLLPQVEHPMVKYHTPT